MRRKWLARDDRLFDPTDDEDVCGSLFMEQVADGMRLFLSNATGGGRQ